MLSRLLLLALLPLTLTGVTACDTPAKSSTTASAQPVAVGAPAPDVTLALHDGKKLQLSSLKGNFVLLYFYPKDDTPG